MIYSRLKVLHTGRCTPLFPLFRLLTSATSVCERNLPCQSTEPVSCRSCSCSHINTQHSGRWRAERVGGGGRRKKKTWPEDSGWYFHLMLRFSVSDPAVFEDCMCLRFFLGQAHSRLSVTSSIKLWRDEISDDADAEWEVDFIPNKGKVINNGEALFCVLPLYFRACIKRVIVWLLVWTQGIIVRVFFKENQRWVFSYSVQLFSPERLFFVPGILFWKNLKDFWCDPQYHQCPVTVSQCPWARIPNPHVFLHRCSREAQTAR